MNGLLGLPAQASEHAASIDFTMGLVHLLMLLLFVGWAIYFIYVLFRFRSSRNPKADHRGTRTHASSYVEAGVAIFEAILLIGFSIPLWAERVADFPPEGESQVVRVVAEQFVWNVHYPGEDGIFGRVDASLIDTQLNPLGIDRDDPYGKDDVTTINQLYLPVNKPALIRLSSKDVIHSFALNEMRVKQDVVPGLEIPVWFQPTVTTAEMRQQKGNPQYNYEIACAQLCGIGHATMRGYMTILPPDEFEAWLREKAEAAAQQQVDPFFN